MCGIAGEIDYRDTWNTSSLLERKRIGEAMRDALTPRGPDQNQIYLDEQAMLVHTRLAVVDWENGRQPMRFAREEQEYFLIYNGELYNTPEIRLELENLGYVFTGHSDTEVVLKAFAAFGERCVERFNGIFAFAVWEKHSQRLFLARDRIGVKPLFYAKTANGLVFASEMKAILRHPAVPPRLSRKGIAEMMLIGPGRTIGCGVLEGMEEVPPACCGWLDRQGLSIQRYWSLRDGECGDTFQQTAEHVRYLVQDAIQRQLVSDVPVGTFLSGGLDSSIITAIAANWFVKEGVQLDTFSVSYQDDEKYFVPNKFEPNSDGYYIDIMRNAFHTNHHNIVLHTADLVEGLFRAVEARDLPGMADVDSSMLLFCQQVKEQVTVALSGECADEIFGGYPWYRDPDIRAIDGFPWAQSTAYRVTFLQEGILDGIDLPEYVQSRYRETIRSTDLREGLSPLEERMRQMMHLNLDWFMQTLLDRKDRMSMANGLEVRVPFCDYRIAEYLYRVPWEFKDYEGREKGLLRFACRGLLPEEVLWRKKSPYPKTHHPAYLQAVSLRLAQLLEDGGAPIWQIIRPAAARQLLEENRSVPWYGQLMTTPQTIAYLLQINHWLEHYHIRLVDC